VGLVLPELQGKLDGMSIRVPTPNVSVVDLVAVLKKQATAEKVNKALKKAASGKMKGILGFCEEPLVSMDFNGNTLSSIVDASLTTVMDGNLVKVISWYDNETGFSHRMIDLTLLIAKSL
jgi:glyceraldehyde 3-phosphate dehydrogenase